MADLARCSFHLEVESLIDESKLQPIVEIRRHEHLADACGGDILKLLKAGVACHMLSPDFDLCFAMDRDLSLSPRTS